MMRTITEQLVSAAKGEFVEQSEISDPQQKWSMFNDGGVECEVGELLYSFIRAIKPKYVLETGTHRGAGAAYMASGLKANGFGKLHTIEFIDEYFHYSMDLIVKLKLAKYVTCYMMDAAEFQPTNMYDMILLDTEPQTRFSELLKYYPKLRPGGYVFIHDLHRHMHQLPNEEHGFAWPYGELPEEIKQLVRSDKLRPFHFGTPRGLTGFYKTTDQDYQWLN